MRESFSQTFPMQTPSITDSRIAEFARLIETKGDIASLQQHLKEVIEGDAFKGSHRSGQFLQYIIDQAIAGHFDALKERVIGMELFGRSASYDTGDDAIVRVTASDVRKRLLQHYGRYGATSEYRINLPSDSLFGVNSFLCCWDWIFKASGSIPPMIWGAGERLLLARRFIVRMSPPGYPSAWLLPSRARFRFTRRLILPLSGYSGTVVGHRRACRF